MLDIQQKRKLRSVMYNRITLGVLAVLLLFMTHSTWVVYKKKVSSEEMKKSAQEKVLVLGQRKEDLETKIDQLGTVSGIEEEIRSKFSVVRTGEKMVVVIPSDEKNSSSTVKKVTLWERLIQFFE